MSRTRTPERIGGYRSRWHPVVCKYNIKMKQNARFVRHSYLGLKLTKRKTVVFDEEYVFISF